MTIQELEEYVKQYPVYLKVKRVDETFTWEAYADEQRTEILFGQTLQIDENCRGKTLKEGVGL